MDWDQIESKWAAMARRVRADFPADFLTTKSEVTRLSLRRSGRVISKTTVIVEPLMQTGAEKPNANPTK